MAMRALLLVVFGLFASTVHAWGNDGHRITGYIADTLLTESTRQHLRELFGDDDLARLATLLDDNREQIETQHPGAARWHYENRRVCGSDIQACRQGQCLTSQLEHFIQVARDETATRNARAEAITILVHLLGDLHQPLHLADNGDRGGNDTWVRFPRDPEPHRLHEVWDSGIVRMNMRRRSPYAYAQMLLRRFNSRLHAWRIGDVNSWAVETHRIGVAEAYRTLPDFSCAMRAPPDAKIISLPAEYIASSRSIVAEQLTKAGVRIAVVLNSALGEHSEDTAVSNLDGHEPPILKGISSMAFLVVSLLF